MVGSIYFIQMPYSNFTEFKGRPVLAFKQIDKNDILVLPLTTNLNREGVRITQSDIMEGSLKKESVIIVPKLTAIDTSLINSAHKIAVLKEKSFSKVARKMCEKSGC